MCLRIGNVPHLTEGWEIAMREHQDEWAVCFCCQSGSTTQIGLISRREQETSRRGDVGGFSSGPLALVLCLSSDVIRRRAGHATGH